MIKASNLSKHFGKRLVVDNVSFNVQNGKVTGFLGPNGAGKSTTMRLMLGLAQGHGTTTYDDKKLYDYPQPSSVIGILLEAKSFHPTRTAYSHLKILATAGNIPVTRVDEVLDIVGLKSEAKHKPGKFSLGMSQRLGIAAALLGSPKYLMLDEPANGLDPEGIVWLRKFLQEYASQGHGVLVSSHLLSEMSQMADNVVVIGRGKLITQTSIAELLSSNVHNGVFVRTSKLSQLEKVLQQKKHSFEKLNDGIVLSGVTTDEVGKIAFELGIPIFELAKHQASLEEAFLELTADAQEYQGHGSHPS